MFQGEMCSLISYMNGGEFCHDRRAVKLMSSTLFFLWTPHTVMCFSFFLPLLALLIKPDSIGECHRTNGMQTGKWIESCVVQYKVDGGNSKWSNWRSHLFFRTLVSPNEAISSFHQLAIGRGLCFHPLPGFITFFKLMCSDSRFDPNFCNLLTFDRNM